eukprot:CAMPEP_0206459460 /NCGR_PEP_ID=MMETSP0324_2-20121206/24183_1 /ASSEMBLY_ACC=CAM_ASM_000836 /TAXON_ID=2866 /ORGANISM="Crypthecodinium cohnii, Strain Seligo" /LENGTH=286 /DNA_ID=CAMNT_0053931003 /DNA_START=51 /DNA_END=911 /DNA_ORIENTATION=+
MGLSLVQSLFFYALFMVLAISLVSYFVATAPPLPEAQCANIVSAMDIVKGRLVREPQESILNLWKCLREYKKDNWWHTTGGLWLVYVLFKVFGPFGAGTSMALSILIGALYDEFAEPNTGYSLLAHVLGTSGEVFGGAGGWIMSYVIGREILLHFAAEKMAKLKEEMDKFQGSLFRYMLFLRISPLFPNWFVNYSTALVGMPFHYFFFASIIAIQPAATMSIAMGGMLRDVGEEGLDLARLAKRGSMMGMTMMVLSLPLIPADDWNKYIGRIKAFFGKGKEKQKEG